LDLVEVAPKNRPPVCRVMDYGKYVYQQNKRQRESKKTHAAKKIKEIKIRAKIEKHDLDFKIKHIRTFLGKNFKVKVTVIYRGREITHTEIGRKLIAKVIAELGDEAVVESAPKMEGRALIAVLAPAPKKAREKKDAPETETGTPASETGTPASETGTPASETGTPASETGPPVTETGTPASDTGTPASETGTPAPGDEPEE
jgi:translation initiation factor IF-3